MNRPQLDFPLLWEFKIIAMGTDEAFAAIAAVIRDHGFDQSPRASNASRNGTYVTYTVQLSMDSRDQLDGLTRALGMCPGVRYLL